MTEANRSIHAEFEKIRQDVIRLAAMVTELIPRVTDALLSGDIESAQQVIELDDETDSLSLEIEEHLHHVLALYNPMASDLRKLITALKMNGEIERSGDLVTNIAKISHRIHGMQFDPRMRGLVEQMSEEAQRLFRLAIDAYADENAALATALDDIDDRLDALSVEFVEAFIEARTAGTIDLQHAVQLMLIARYYERIGDHAVNVGEKVQYMVTGWMPEQAGAMRVAARRATSPGQGSEAHEQAADPSSEAPE